MGVEFRIQKPPEKHGFLVLKHLIIFVKKLRKFCGKIMRILLAPKNPQLVPMDHGAKIRIRFFALRMERSSMYNPQFCVHWQPIVEDHMAKTTKMSKKIILKENNFEWDSGYSDG